MDERRSNGRTRIAKAASLFFGGQTGVRSCDVNLTDLTEGGAGIYKQGLAILPPTFELCFDNLRRQCRLIWRKGNSFGVAFEDQSSLIHGDIEIGDNDFIFPEPAFSILADPPIFAGPQHESGWSLFGSEVMDRKSQQQVDFRFMIAVVIAMALPALISLGTYLAMTMFLVAS
jgi:hypothetical protein